jgi:hypothetical protein
MYMLYTLYEHLNNTCYNVYIYKSMYNHIYIYIHTYIHTYTHTCMHAHKILVIRYTGILAIQTLIPACAIGYVNTLIISTTVIVMMPPYS